MVTVTVRYFGMLSQITGKRREKVVLDEGTTVGDLADLLRRKYGRELARRLESDSGMAEVVFAVGGEIVDPSRVLEHDDEVVVSHPVGGG